MPIARNPDLSAAAAATWKPTAFWILLGLAARTLIAFLVPLLPDETYYWDWSRHLHAGYFNHPPGIALVIRVGTEAVGNNVFGVRIGPAILALIVHVSLVIVTARISVVKDGVRAAVVMALIPFATLGLVIATPDAPLLASASVALLCLERALNAPCRSRACIGWWVLTGVALGAALLSKYTAILLPGAFFIACIVYAPLRVRLREPGPWLAALVALVMFLPVIAWNANSDWISFRFQLNHGFGVAPRGAPITRELEMVGGQLGLATPILSVLLILAVLFTAWHEWSRRSETLPATKDSTRFAFGIIALVPIIFFAVSAWRRPIEPNWPALSYPAAVVLLATMPNRWARARMWKSGLLLATTVLAVAVLQVWQPILPIEPRADPIGHAHGWPTLANAVDRARQDAFLEGTVTRWVAANRYQDASELAFHLPDQPQVFSLNLNGRANQYDLWEVAGERIRPVDGLVAAFDATPRGDSLAMVVGAWFTQSQRGETVELRRGEGVVETRRVWMYRGAKNIPRRHSQLPMSARRR